MSKKDQDKLLKCLIGIVAWNGAEDNAALAKRLTAAHNLLRRIAPDALKAEIEKMAKATEY